MLRLIIAIGLAAISLHAATIAHHRFADGSTDKPVFELTDSSGNGHHARVIGQEPFELITDVPTLPGAAGLALDARGRNDYAIIPHHADFAPAGDWTIEFFIKPDLFHHGEGGATNIASPFPSSLNTNLSYTILAKPNTNEPTSLGSAWAFHYQPANGWVIFTLSFGADRAETFIVPKDLRDSQWHHVAVVLDSNDLRLYIDGFNTSSSRQPSSPSISWGTGPIYIGAFARQAADYSVQDRNFDGLLDEIRFSDAALTPEHFVVDFAPLLYPPIDVRAHSATELEFPTQPAQLYRIEQFAADIGLWRTLGYRLADGATTSFFHRDEALLPTSYRVTLDSNTEAPLQHTLLDAIELRFPTDSGQLYFIERCQNLDCAGQDPDQTFLLGDGGMWSHFERISTQSRFFKVHRY